MVSSQASLHIPKRGMPVIIITGFLGSGKTTLLNQILKNRQDLKVAVLVNEFGDIDIVSQLLVSIDEDMVQLSNGCICCTINENLVDAVYKVLEREEPIDYLVIETTGLADTAPVIQTFFMDEDVRSQASLDAVVTVVDAKHIHQHWDADEAIEQLAFADVMLLNKTDLVTPTELNELEQRIRSMNAMAKIYRTQDAQVEMDSILGVGAFDLSRALEIDPNFLGEDAHEHDETVGSVAIAELGAMNFDKLNVWLSELLRTQGTDIFRMKGILNIAGEDQRFVFQAVHMLMDGLADPPVEAQRNPQE